MSRSVAIYRAPVQPCEDDKLDASNEESTSKCHGIQKNLNSKNLGSKAIIVENIGHNVNSSSFNMLIFLLRTSTAPVSLCVIALTLRHYDVTTCYFLHDSLKRIIASIKPPMLRWMSYHLPLRN